MSLALIDAAFSYVTPRRGRVEVFSDLSIRVGEGECLGIMGAEGSGKSTLLMLLAGLLPLERGKLLVAGADVHRDAAGMARFRRASGVAFQFPEEHFLNAIVEEEVLFTARLSGREPAGAAAVALGLCGLPDPALLKRSVHTLSVGEARRVALAALFPSDPAFVFMDEPTAGLDARGLEHLTRLVHLFRERRRTVLIVSHDPEFLTAAAGRVIRLEGGRILADGLPGDLLGPHTLPPGWGVRSGLFRPSR